MGSNMWDLVLHIQVDSIGTDVPTRKYLLLDQLGNVIDIILFVGTFLTEWQLFVKIDHFWPFSLLGGLWKIPIQLVEYERSITWSDFS